MIYVIPGSAAEDAGLREYDFIYRVNDEDIKTSDDLIRLVQHVGVGGELRIQMIRRGEQMTITARVGEATPGP